MPKRSRAKALLFAAAATLAALALGVGLVVEAGRWLQFSEKPEKADLIVVLAGGPDRAIKAAELYQQGFAPEIWMSRPARDPSLAHLDRIGVVLPAEEELVRRILVKQGVPASRIKLYGRDVLSTAEEALCLREALGDRGVSILLVSHRTHLRRAKLIFQRSLPRARVIAVASDPEPPKARWWTDKNLSVQIVVEASKFAYYEAGGRFLSRAR